MKFTNSTRFTIIFLATMTLLIASSGLLLAQKIDNPSIAKKIEAYKKDEKGPYKDLRWFCPDGSVLPPKERCSQPGGNQRARYKDEVVALQKSNHIFLGQILATTEINDFWDAENNHARLKQFQLEKYLQSVDNGWVLRRGQYYRGAVQIEDEEAWGKQFYARILAEDESLIKNYFLIRQSLKDIPHAGDNSKAQLMRSQSAVIADTLPSFMNLRVKIHGQPEASDIEKVKAFKTRNSKQLTPYVAAKIDELIVTMEGFYQTINLQSLRKYVTVLPATSSLRTSLLSFIDNKVMTLPIDQRTAAISDMMWKIRTEILTEKKATSRIAMLDVSNKLEEIVFKEASKWQTNDLSSLIHKMYYLSQACAAAGYLELWEWEKIANQLTPPTDGQATLQLLNDRLQFSRSLVEWGTGLVKANYQDVVNLFAGFEPLSYGFLDDRIRSSLLLPLGNCVGQLGNFIATSSGFNNAVMNLSNQSQIRGLNPGYTLGELVVVQESPEDVEVSADKIYLFERPPADLKPVAGIATVSEGNLVSHVQLLARNLGIPNAVLSDENLREMAKYSGQKVFYAVSNKGTVIMKPADAMTTEESMLFSVQKRNQDKIEVPVSKVKLNQTSILNLRDVKSEDSGQLCGPKAANLGQLKITFPDKVVEGFVIPFGIFRKHMEQPMPDQGMSYWQFLNQVFRTADKMRMDGASDQEVEVYQLKQLEILRAAIKNISFLPSFKTDLETSFEKILGQPMGKVPVFLRSDTNMEDLKEFTGAGLNLTVFNAVASEKIINGIKDVWASPYTERSYKWRQKYLLNPENVFPSILVIPSVDVDCSGVLITKGVTSNDPADLTIAFSRGAGGAVDGQSAESYLIKKSGETILIAPSREPYYNRLPFEGGTSRKIATFEKPILTEDNLKDIVDFTATIKEVLPKTPGVGSEGPYDVELGFQNDKLWLFQVRPFVENKKALSSTYLESITPKIQTDKIIDLATKL